MADPNYPEDLLYHPEHAWARMEGDVATFGITWHAQDTLGDVLLFEPPDLGTRVGAGESYADVESAKAVSEVFAPLSGQVVEVNDGLGDPPAAINRDPYGDGWLVRVKPSDPAETEQLLDAAAYVALVSES